MPLRPEPFINGGIYHVFNKTIDKRQTFTIDCYSVFFLEILEYYRSIKSVVSHSRLKLLSPEENLKIFREIAYKKYFRIEILAYCLMPNHFHLLIKQFVTDGIPRFVSNVVNSFTRYYNLQHERKGPVFLPNFKSVKIESDEQLMHVSRYIHLNPYSSGLVRDRDKLPNYQWSSFPEYLSQERRKVK
ncbi:transposase [Candidatus Roizmanbacteria bacterium]|nr:transposase [Candidatus Roizmanbacteria bacterium]